MKLPWTWWVVGNKKVGEVTLDMVSINKKVGEVTLDMVSIRE